VRTPRPEGDATNAEHLRPETGVRAEEQVFAQELGLGVQQCHQVLQLIAETEGAPWLVVTVPRPEAARERLVYEPAVVRTLRVGSGVSTFTAPSVRLQYSHTASSAPRAGRTPGSDAPG